MFNEFAAEYKTSYICSKFKGQNAKIMYRPDRRAWSLKVSNL